MLCSCCGRFSKRVPGGTCVSCAVIGIVIIIGVFQCISGFGVAVPTCHLPTAHSISTPIGGYTFSIACNGLPLGVGDEAVSSSEIFAGLQRATCGCFIGTAWDANPRCCSIIAYRKAPTITQYGCHIFRRVLHHTKIFIGVQPPACIAIGGTRVSKRSNPAARNTNVTRRAYECRACKSHCTGTAVRAVFCRCHSHIEACRTGRQVNNHTQCAAGACDGPHSTHRCCGGMTCCSGITRACKGRLETCNVRCGQCRSRWAYGQSEGPRRRSPHISSGIGLADRD